MNHRTSLAEQDIDVDLPGKVDREDRAMWFRAIGNSFRALIEVITSMVAPGLAAGRAASGALASRRYRQCDPSASGYCCLRIVYPDEWETGIIKFPGCAVSRQPSGKESEHGAA